MKREEILNTLRQKACEIVPDINGEDIVEKCYLRDLDIDSIDRNDIIIELCDTLDVKVRMIEFSGKNVGEILDIIEDKINNK